MTNSTGLSGTDLSTLERKRRVHRLRVQFPARTTVLDLIERCLRNSAYSADPKSLFIGGDTGVGKSTLIGAFMSRHPRVVGDEVDTVPVLAASMPAVATVKSTASALLSALGDPKAYNGELAKLTSRLLHYLEACNVKMIVLDEFQHVIDRESSKVLARTADWLKTVLDGSGIPLVLVGLPHSERILDENPQLARRFPHRTLLGRFGWNTAKRRVEFRMLLRVVDEHLPFAIRAHLDAPEMAEWFFKHTAGTLGLVMLLVREAAELAIDRNAARIEWDDLRAAHMQMHGRGPDSPPSRPRRGGKKNAPKASDVLRT